MARPKKDSGNTLADRIERAGGFDAVLSLLEAGKWVHEVAATIDVTAQNLRTWVRADPAREKAWDGAIKSAAEHDAYMARKVIEDLKPDATTAEFQRARELAHHHRWQAKMRDRKRFGDQQEITVVTPVSEMSDEQIDREIAAAQAQLAVPEAKRVH